MDNPPIFSQESIQVQAIFLGQRIDINPYSSTSTLADSPLIVKAGDRGCAALFDYGAAVVFGLSAAEEARFLNDISTLVDDPFEQPETEKAVIQKQASRSGKVENDVIFVSAFELPALQIVAEVLAKSVVLAHYEGGAAAVFDRVEPFAASLKHPQGNRRQGQELLDQIGETLLIQNKIVGRVEIIDKPELLWEYPELDRLYLRLEDEYEIRERLSALERKLELVSRTAETALDLQHQNTGLRLERYVVILIVIEILLSLYDLFLDP